MSPTPNARKKKAMKAERVEVDGREEGDEVEVEGREGEGDEGDEGDSTVGEAAGF